MRATRLAVLLLIGAPVCAQQPEPAPPGPVIAPGPAQRPQGLPADAPPQVRLGLRAAAVRAAWPMIPAVVIVPDGDSYIEAVAAWTPRARFPVLIDDGSARSREDIARFVRAFKPKDVVRWKRAGEAAPVDAGRLERAVRTIWSIQLPGEAGAPSIEDQQQLINRWRAVGVVPPGIIAADAADPAWPAALALSAGRVQPIVWVKSRQNVNAALPLEEAAALAKSIEEAAAASGLSWAALGDELETVTLCLNSPVKTQLEAGNIAATTDLLGRGEQEGSRAKGARWAWCGQVFGSEPEAAYRAMCSLFLTPESGWLFDGYQDSDPWGQYDCTEAASYLEKVGLKTTVFDGDRQGAAQWRRAAAAPIEAGLVCVTTHGGADEFNLRPGQCRPGDIPFLLRPAAVYFVHSFSAAVPGERSTVAGRWLERGAYAYFGSVYEPYLHAFTPTPVFAARMASAFPFGAAVRMESEAWKLATIADPLITLGNVGGRIESPLPLADTESVRDRMAAAVGERRYAEGAALLTILGRDTEAAQLAAAVKKEDAAAFTPELAHAAALACFRSGDLPTLLACMAAIPPEQSTGEERDALWLAAGPGLESLDDSAWVTLEKHLRPDQIGRDAHELARAMAPRQSVRAAAELINRVRGRATTDYDRNEFESAAKRFGIRK